MKLLNQSRFNTSALTLLLALSGAPFALAAEQNGLDIMQKSEQQRKVDDESVHVAMELINRGGDVRTRKIELTTQTLKDDQQNSLIRFHQPKSVAGTGLLTVEHLDEADDQWLYLPALKRSRRISPADQTDSFMGTDFTFEDLRPEDLEDFEYKVTGQDTLDGEMSHVIEATPKSPDSQKESGYQKRVLWVRAKDFVVAKIDFYDRQGELQKTFHATDIRPVSDSGVSRAHVVEMENLKTGHKTRLSYEEFKLNQGVDANLFSARTLERSW